MKRIIFLKEDQGSALIVVILTLLVLSLTGIMAMKTATIETEISGNLRSYKEHFYKAESAVREMALSLRDTPDPTLVGSNMLILPDNSNITLSNLGTSLSPDNILTNRLRIVNDPSSVTFQPEPYNSSKVLVVDGGPAPGASMSIGFSHAASSKHRFFVFGNAKESSALGRGVLIEIGYLRRIRY